jgi:hypothetical protein
LVCAAWGIQLRGAASGGNHGSHGNHGGTHGNHSSKAGDSMSPRRPGKETHHRESVFHGQKPGSSNAKARRVGPPQL